MKVFLAAVLFIGLSVLGLCAGILLRKDGHFPQTDVGSNEEMRRRGIRCMKEQDRQMRSQTQRTNFNYESCSHCGETECREIHTLQPPCRDAAGDRR